ncbi:class II fumarate hydratase [Bacillus carboniphilus]|uniref:Fumarate hydratase class II n=1 Tax=Bacillus carboniphilus TaxID=86663 RepID=A0ABY9JPM8_9BACI|nr:class II fumarate hydratase [Bacillus carboniphilus]WLR41359.1 class II fumarate hydratase [Bacillus carboniphilus]
MDFRIEKDTMGEVNVQANKYWRAQTERSLNNFAIGIEKMPIEVIYAFAEVKRAASVIHKRLGKLEENKADAIIKVCDEITTGRLDEHFPLAVWQTGSGTQTNMNVNEVISYRATELLEEDGEFIHPNDDVNMGQSSNDTFPTAMHIAAVLQIHHKLVPAIKQIKQTLQEKQSKFDMVIKIGRTHLQDATPLSVGQEISGWVHMLEKSEQMLHTTVDYIRDLAIGGTAVGTGINTVPNFGELVVEEITKRTGQKFRSSENKFHALTSHDDIVTVHGALKGLAADLMKIANDVRWSASGPRSGIGEQLIPANEPGSSIMPGKVNPTQCEAVTMVAAQVMGNDATIGFAASQGNFQLNVFKPVIIYNLLQSIRLLTDAIVSFDEKCLQGLELNKDKIDENLHRSLMLVTALNPYIGYEKAAKIAKHAYDHKISLKESAITLNILTEKEFDRYVNPDEMIEPK